MRLPVDQSAREQALDPSGSFIVQAPAGSGKTGLLIRRFLILLAHVSVPEEILAITFTRKATAEMRHRVVSALKFQKDDGSPEDNEELLQMSQAALANDQRHNWQLVKNVNRLRIQTIDSFCSELVNRMPWSARFGAPPSIVEDAMPLLRQAALRTLSRVEQNSDPVLAKACGDLISLMDARLGGAVEQLATMLARRDQWMRLSIDHSREQIERWWQETIDDTLQSADGLLSEQWKRSLTELAAFAADTLHQANAGSDKVAPVEACLGLQSFPAPSHQLLDQWRGIVAMLLTAKGEKIRSAVNKNDGFPADKKAEKARIKEILVSLAEDDTGLVLLARILAMPDSKMAEQQWKNIESLLTVLPIAAAELRVLFTEFNQADYIELSQRAEFALGDANNPTDLALVFDHRIQHLMVDEFQDTSAGQLSLLQKLLAGWEPDDGRTAFFVGDPMQSIYRFREAEVANFLDVQANGIADVAPSPLQLETNFRSDAAVVNWCNEAFAIVMPSHDDKVLGAVRYAPATAFWNTAPGCDVAVHPFIDAGEADEANAIVELVRHELDGDRDPTVAILGRTRRSLTLIATQLSEAGILFDAVKLQTLGERQAIQDIVALTCALLQPRDRSAWLGVLRAPWCGLSLAEMTALCSRDLHKPLIEVIAEPDTSNALPADNQNRVASLAAIMTEALEAIGRQPLWQIVEAVWLKLGGPAAYETVDLENCQSYLAMLQQLENEDVHISSTSLEAALKKLWAAGSASAKVKLMTIHGSKGLEFDTVILPGLHRPSKSNNADLIRFRHLPQRLLIAAKPSSAASEDAAYRFLGLLEKESLKNESTRLLYVACTRARQRLHLFGNAKTNSKGALSTPVSNSLLSLLWPVINSHFDHEESEKTDTVDEQNTDSADDFLHDPCPVHRIPASWQPPALQPAILALPPQESGIDDTEAIEFDWAGEVARICGIVVHQIFQQIDTTGWQKWQKQDFDHQARSDCRNRLLESGLPITLLDQAIDMIERALINTRNDSNADWIFNTAHQSIRNEWPVTGVINGRVQHAIIDRCFIAADERGNLCHWIIDFKTSRHDETENLEAFIEQERNRYAKTMQKYALIVRALGAVNTKTALYFPVLKRLEVLD